MPTKLMMQKEIEALQARLNTKVERIADLSEHVQDLKKENRDIIREFKAIEKNWNHDCSSREENEKLIRNAIQTHCAMEYPGRDLFQPSYRPSNLDDMEVQRIANELRSYPMPFRFLRLLYDMLNG